MLKYLIIQLDDTSVSYCHYNNGSKQPRLLPIEALKEAIFWSMKENLTIQVLYPNFEIPAAYHEVLSQIDHADIVPSTCTDKSLLSNADVVVFDTWEATEGYPFMQSTAYVVRTSLSEFFERYAALNNILSKADRLNVVITDVTAFTDECQERYTLLLKQLSKTVKEEYAKGHGVQLNLLTDRMLLDSMNNCNAGWESVSLAPDGKFYVCPAFYFDGKEGYSIGDLRQGLDIKNPQLYRLDHAPICRNCDAWQCKRCVWLNRKTTLEVNTPSHEQCLIAHLERNASRQLLSDIRSIGDFLPDKEIPEIDYLDPFEKIIAKQ